MKKRLLAIRFLAIGTSVAMSAATSAASAQAYDYSGVPYSYGPGTYNYGYGRPYAPAPYAAPPGFFYGYDPYGSAYNWDYYRVDQPGRGNNVESSR